MKDFSIEVHGAHTYDATGAISEPIYLSATYRHPGFRQSTGYDYGRCANPTRAVRSCRATTKAASHCG